MWSALSENKNYRFLIVIRGDSLSIMQGIPLSHPEYSLLEPLVGVHGLAVHRQKFLQDITADEVIRRWSFVETAGREKVEPQLLPHIKPCGSSCKPEWAQKAQHLSEVPLAARYSHGSRICRGKNTIKHAVFMIDRRLNKFTHSLKASEPSTADTTRRILVGSYVKQNVFKRRRYKSDIF